MHIHRIKQGLTLAIGGAPEQRIYDAPALTRVGVVEADYPGLRARVRIAAGETVRRGQLLFEDRRTPGVRYTSPAAGKVIAIHRGARRALQAIVIQLSPGEQSGSPSDLEFESFSAYRAGHSESAEASEIRGLLVESGLWTAFRTRPFGCVPAPDTTPHAIFVNAMDSEPLAAAPKVLLGEAAQDFQLGLRLVTLLTEGTTYLCVHADTDWADAIDAPVSLERFAGPHPSGTTGVHIDRLVPVGRRRTVWTIGYQDVIGIATLFQTGQLPVQRIVALGGPAVRRPRLLRSRLGACVAEITHGELADGSIRIISGSVLSGRTAMGPSRGFLGRYQQQISALPETIEPDPSERLSRRGFSLASFRRRLRRVESYDFAAPANTVAGPILPLGRYEKVMPFDTLPTPLLRALAAGDIEQAEKLGCLSLDEEDVALASFVCPGKTDFAPLLRAALDRIREEST